MNGTSYASLLAVSPSFAKGQLRRENSLPSLQERILLTLKVRPSTLRDYLPCLPGRRLSYICRRFLGPARFFNSFLLTKVSLFSYLIKKVAKSTTLYSLCQPYQQLTTLCVIKSCVKGDAPFETPILSENYNSLYKSSCTPSIQNEIDSAH